MATQIRPNRLEVSDRFPMLGFTVRTDGNAKRYEIAIGTSPELFGPDGKGQRSRQTFYSTRAAGPLPIERGESVYVLPAEVLARFVGQKKLYYGLATFSNGASSAEVVSLPNPGSPYINIAGLTGRSLQRVRVLPNRQRTASGYGKNGSEMEWSGDAAMPGTQPMTPASVKSPAAKSAAPGPAAGSVHYDDGFYPPLSDASAPKQPQPQAKSLADDGDQDTLHGIEGPIPDDGAAAQGLARSMGSDPEYPQASRFEPAANYRAVSGTRQINRIVIHITDGSGKINGTIAWFQNPDRRNSKGKKIYSSAHYVVGQDGEVVQMVHNNDIAWHASTANADSIGIEHEARSPGEKGRSDKGLMPTEAEYCASAALVNWLCSQFNIPMDRQHIVGHNEASPSDGHTDCPDGVWDWDYYMGLVTSGSCYTKGATASSLSSFKTIRKSSARASALDNQSFDENWNEVEVIGQPDYTTCWATAAAMVVGWRDRVCIDVGAIQQMFGANTGLATNAGLSPNDRQKLADALGLVAEPPQSYTVDGFRGVLENYGPAWVGIRTDDGWNHAVVVTGIYGDGSQDGTYVRIHDPWGRSQGTPTLPGAHNTTPGQGSRYKLTFSEFEKEYEDRITSNGPIVNVQILHARDTGGRTINAGADQSYALATRDDEAGEEEKSKEHHHHHHKHHKHNGHHEHHDRDEHDEHRDRKHEAVAAAADASSAQPVQLPQARALTGLDKTIVRGAVDALVAVAAGPVGAALPLLIDLVNKQGFSVGLGLGGDAGLLGGAGLSFGVILAPNDEVGVFGSVAISAGLLAGISAGTRVIVIHGGIDAFNDTGYALGVTLDAEAGPSGTVMALFDSHQDFDGVSFQLGLAASLSPIQIFASTEKSVSAPVTQSLADDQDSRHGIDGPIPDGSSLAQSYAGAMAMSPEYPQASRFEPADAGNYHAVASPRTINRIVIHITDGGKAINGTVGWFKNPAAKVSAHYVIGQDGEIVQMVKHNDIAWHASSANGDSIGIEHVSNTRGLNPTPAEYCASAALVNWLCGQFNLPMDRTHVLGHSEADPKTSHKGCPNAVWDWDYYMGLVASGTCYDPQTQSQALGLPKPPKRRARVQSLDAASARTVAGSPITTVTGADGNVSWDLDQFPGVKRAAQLAVAPLQSAETIQLTDWPYCDHRDGTRSCAGFTVNWKFSGQALGEVRIAPTGTQQGAQPLRVEARIADGKDDKQGGAVSIAVRLTYHFSTSDGPEVVAQTELMLYSDGSIDQKSNWLAQAVAA